MKLNLPNSLSVLRIILVFPIIFCIVIGKPIISFWLFVVANISDFLDGYLARAYNQSTNFGRMIDPIADKFLISSVLLLLTYYEFVPLYLTLLVMLRDVLLVGFGFYLRALGLAHKLYVTFISKVNTVLLMTFVSWIMLQHAYGVLSDPAIGEMVVSFFIMVLVFTTITTGLHYLYIAVRVYREGDVRK